MVAAWATVESRVGRVSDALHRHAQKRRPVIAANDKWIALAVRKWKEEKR
jgi:hypothetical protein